MSEKLKSRKLWIAIAGAVISAASPFFGVDPDLAIKLFIAILGGYVGTEGVIDAARAFDTSEK